MGTSGDLFYVCSSDSEVIRENWTTNAVSQNASDINIGDVSFSSADTYTPRAEQTTRCTAPIEITNWEPILDGDKLIISGLIAGSIQTDRVCKQRLSSLIFKDDDGLTCCILGPMKNPNGAPEVICNQFKYIYKINDSGDNYFKDGIPTNWLNICKIWKLFNESTNKNTFDWMERFMSISVNPLVPRNAPRHYINTAKRSKSKLMKKYEKYKSMVERQRLRDCLSPETDNETDICINISMNIRRYRMRRNEPTSLNLRTSYYINHSSYTNGDSTSASDFIYLADLPDTPASPNLPELPQVAKNTVQCQTELTLNDFIPPIVNDAPIERSAIINNNNIINIQNEDSSNKSNNQIINDNISELNDDSSSLEFGEHIVANSTQIQLNKPQQTNETCKNINYICSKTLERFAKRPESSNRNIDDCINENADFIDIDLFSQTVLLNNNSNTSSNNNSNNSGNEIIEYASNKSESSESSPINPTKGRKRKADVLEDKPVNRSIRCSLRKRKILNYREIIFNRIRVPESAIITPKKRKSNSPAETLPNKNCKKYKKDAKLFKKCFVLLARENLQKVNKSTAPKHSEETLNEKAPEDVAAVAKSPAPPEDKQPPGNAENPNKNPQKENIRVHEQHVFKAPLLPRVLKKNMFNKTFHLPNHMPKINRKKLSLPANPHEMWQIIKCRQKPQDCENDNMSSSSSPSPFSILSDVSSESCDKKRRKLFSPDNWMQSDGCLKTLSQNRYESSDDTRFSIRFDNIDTSMDSEFSDSSTLK